MRKLKKSLSIVLAALLAIGLLAACGQAPADSSPSPSSAESNSAAPSGTPAEPVKLKFAGPNNATEAPVIGLIKMA